MGNRIENLGDYNTMRIMLQKKNGDLSAVRKDIELNALPKQAGMGAIIGTVAGVFGTLAVQRISVHLKKRRIQQEKKLEERLKTALMTENLVEEDMTNATVDTEEPSC